MSKVEVTMLVQVSGTRDGQNWPAPGEALTVPADEAASLVAAGLAEALAEAPGSAEVEVKVASEDDLETATSATRRTKK